MLNATKRYFCSMPLWTKVEKTIADHGLFHKNDSILVAISGGIDSVVLARILCMLGYKIAFAHVNYGLRGEESQEDERFVQSLAQELSLTCYTTHIDTKQHIDLHGGSLQEVARTLRYTWLEDIRTQYHFTVIATAHHSDDQVETVLYRMFTRGAGLKGLSGIPYRMGNLVRPLLDVSKSELIAFSKEHGIKYREDSSNKKNLYDRNRIRNTILPSIQEHFPHASQSLVQNVQLWKEANVLQQEFIAKHVDKHIKRIGAEIHFPIAYLQQSAFAKTILWNYVEPFGFSSHQLENMIHLMDAENSKFVASSSHRLFKYNRWLVLATLNAERQTDHILIEGIGVHPTPWGTITIEDMKNIDLEMASKNNNATIAYVNAKMCSFPLVLRRKKQGDYFFPLGMRKKKKIARFLIDQKASTTQKEQTYVLEHNGRIVWVLGWRADDRYKLTPSTHHALRFSWKPA